jgi:Fe2+ or Zn2+ uptake regulation protein
MSDAHLQHILKAHHLRITNCRLDVLQAFQENPSALSQGVLEDRFPQYDRVTLYRTLNSFLDSGILHKSPMTRAQPHTAYAMTPVRRKITIMTIYTSNAMNAVSSNASMK